MPTERALAIVVLLCAIMILAMILRRPRAAHLHKCDLLLWAGGLLLFVSMFFIAGYGPWGAEMSGYAALTWNWGFPDFLYALPRVTPELIGAIVWIAAFLANLSPSPNAKTNQWRIVALTVGAIPIVWLATVLWLRFTTAPPGQPTLGAVWLTASISLFTSIALAIPVLLLKSDIRRNAGVHMVTAGLLLMWTSVNLVRALKSGSSLTTAGIGYWMHIGGLVLIFVAGVWEALMKSSAPSGHCATCGYNLAGLTSDKCPECGTNFRNPAVPAGDKT